MNIFKKAPMTFVYRSLFIEVLCLNLYLNRILVNVPNNRNYVLTRKCTEFN